MLYRRFTVAVQPDPFGFGGQAGYYTDTETGLILCTHRYYDPQAGRWLTRDPMGYRGGINLYGYTKNNPVNSADPSGYAQLVGVPGFAGSPAHGHEYIVTTCGGTVNPTMPQSFGFWPSGNGPLGGAFNGESPGAINAQSGAINVYSGTNSDPDAGLGPNPSAGQDIEDANGDPAFGQRLCKCIADSAASQPAYSVEPFAGWKGSNIYVCYTWAQDMWDCAKGEPSLLDSTLGTATSTLSSLAPL